MSQTTYHGDSSREHRFWVYPKDRPLVDTRWEAYDPKNLCDSFTLLEGDSSGGHQTYKCNGHQRSVIVIVKALLYLYIFLL